MKWYIKATHTNVYEKRCTDGFQYFAWETGGNVDVPPHTHSMYLKYVKPSAQHWYWVDL